MYNLTCNYRASNQYRVLHPRAARALRGRLAPMHGVHENRSRDVAYLERPLHASRIMMPRRILCPIELSSGCERARRVATRLAQETNVEVQLVSGAADHILQLAEPTDLIVIEAQGRTGLSRLLLGSMAEKIARHARCSVLVVDPLAEPHSYGNILVAVDFSECSRRALELAGDLAGLCGATVTLVHVIELPVVYGQEDDLHAAGLLDDWSELVEAHTRTRVTRLLRTGNPAPQVLACAAEDPSLDLVVVGSHGRTGIERMLLGSVAEQVVRHATRTVMVAR